MLSIATVPLNRLVVSPLNVRKTNADEDIDGLARDIRANGLKQNLVVVPSVQKEGYYEVVAGGRRLAALDSLVFDGRVRLDEPIPVLIEAREQGRETSLSENLHRVAMNPADEYVAYATIVQDHHGEADPVAYCAKRFGVARSRVEERLRLAALAPEILDAVRDGRVSPAAARAYAAFADHELQLGVFRAECRKAYSPHHPASIRDQLRGRALPVDCAQMRYVGLEAYLDAGGRTEREMFLGDGEAVAERAIDPSLLDRLAREKAAEDAAARAAADGFAHGLVCKGFGPYPAFPDAPKGAVRWWVRSMPTVADYPAEQRAEATAVYKLATDGSGLLLDGAFRPAAAQSAPQPRVDHEQRWREQERRGRLLLLAARASLPSFAGTPLEGAVLPADDDDPRDFIEPVDLDVDVGGNELDEIGDVYVLVRVRVSAEQIAAHRAEAEAALEAAEAAEAAERATDGDPEAAADVAAREAADA